MVCWYCILLEPDVVAGVTKAESTSIEKFSKVLLHTLHKPHKPRMQVSLPPLHTIRSYICMPHIRLPFPACLSPVANRSTLMKIQITSEVPPWKLRRAKLGFSNQVLFCLFCHQWWGIIWNSMILTLSGFSSLLFTSLTILRVWHASSRRTKPGTTFEASAFHFK